MNTSNFKYATAIAAIDPCPGPGCIEREREAYRWVHSPETEKDFIPLAAERPIVWRPIDESDLRRLQCLSWGLSVYDTLEAARASFEAALKLRRGAKRDDFIAQKGDKVALIPLRPHHGCSTPSNNDGHFTLYCYEGINLEKDIVKIFDIFETDDGPDGNH